MAGTFTLSFGGQTTTALAATVSAADMATAINALSTVTGVTVTSAAANNGFVYTVTLGAKDEAAMTCDKASLTGTTPSCAVAEATKGVVKLALTAYSCACAALWTGKDCTTAIACVNSSYVLNAGRTACALCPSGFESASAFTKCVDIDDCLAKPCESSGTCADAGANAYKCTCPSPWGGKRCTEETKLTTQISSSCSVAAKLGVSIQLLKTATTTALLSLGMPSGTRLALDTATAGTVKWTIVTARAHGAALTATLAATATRTKGGVTDAEKSFASALRQAGFSAATAADIGSTAVASAGKTEIVCLSGWGGTGCLTKLSPAPTPTPSPPPPGDFFGVSIHKFACMCPTGWSGGLCATDIDECAAKPCASKSFASGATRCLESNSSAKSFFDAKVATGKHVCGCALGWSGATCAADIDECSSGPCLNSGACTDSTDSASIAKDAFSCACAKGWSGATCATDVDECARDKPCKNDADGFMAAGKS